MNAPPSARLLAPGLMKSNCSGICTLVCALRVNGVTTVRTNSTNEMILTGARTPRRLAWDYGDDQQTAHFFVPNRAPCAYPSAEEAMWVIQIRFYRI